MVVIFNGEMKERKVADITTDLALENVAGKSSNLEENNKINET